MKNYRFLLFNVLFLLPALIFAQQTITGTVTDAASGMPLPGVGVIVKGGTLGAATDFDGNYTIQGVNQGDVLVFSYIGFRTLEITVGTSNRVDAALQEDAQALDEVVVIGYGTTTVKDATGSVISVKAEDLNRGVVVSSDQMLTGKVAGVQVTSGGGAPGAGSTIRIRGGASLNATNDPLIIIDGVPVDNSGIAGMRNALNTINPNDIESFTVLKDASATAIYGSRASNGVIIITTKKGRAEELSGAFRSTFTVNQNYNTLDVLTADEYRDFVNQKGLPSDIALLGNANTDWQNEIYRTGFGMDHNLSLYGGSEKLNFRGSLGYTETSGTLKTSELERGTFAFSMGAKALEDHMKIDLNIKSSMVDNRFADWGAIGNAIQFDPTKPVYDASSRFGGFWEWTQADGRPISIGAPRNPVALLDLRNNTSSATRHIGNIQIDYQMHFMPELRANLNLGFDKSSSDGDDTIFNSATINANDPAELDAKLAAGRISTYDQSKENLLLDFYLNYANEYESLNSTIDFMVGYSYQNFENQGSSTSNLQDASLTETFDYHNQLNLQSFFGRLKWSLADKYLLTVTYRRDGSSRFVGDNKWGNFPSAAFAWKMIDEDFLKDSNTFTNLKVRASWGITGQQDIGNYYPAIATYLGSTNSAQYQFGSSFYNTFRAEPFNTTLKWEETETYNFGLDFGFVNNVIYGSLDYYQRETIDLLNFIPFPAGSSLSNAGNANIGTMKNEGIELTLSSKVIDTQDMNLSFTGNYTYQTTEITKLTTNDDPSYEGVEVGGFSGGVGNTIQRHTVGYAPNTFFVYQQVYDENGKPVEGVYVDRNGDGQITTADKYRYHRPTPDHLIGFTTDLSYKNWSFNMAWRANVGNYVYNNVDSNHGFRDQLLNPAFPETISNGVQTVVTSGFINGGIERYLSDYYIREASFVKWDNATIGYNFGDALGKNTTLNLSGTVTNILTITDYDGIDPEVGGGIDYNIYPRPTIYQLGVNLNF